MKIYHLATLIGSKLNSFQGLITPGPGRVLSPQADHPPVLFLVKNN
jgi:hypothetical protein